MDSQASKSAQSRPEKAGQGPTAPSPLPMSKGLFWRSAVFNLGQILSTLVIAPVGLCLFFLPFARRYHLLTQWARFNLWWLKKTCGLSFQVRGQEHIPPDPAVILCKHQSAWETLALQRIFPPQIWVLKRELLWLPLFGWCLAILDPIAIDRRAGQKTLGQIVRQGRQRLATGRWVVVFPEGTRVAPGETRRFGGAGAALAQATGYPVVPVAHNAGRYWPRSGFIKYPGIIQVVIGPRIETKDKTATQVNQEAYDWMVQTMKAIESPELYDCHQAVD